MENKILKESLGFRNTIICSQEGVSFVELAIALPLMVLILAGMMDFGLALQEVQYISDSARHGARIAAEHSFVSPTEAPKACTSDLSFRCSTSKDNPLPISEFDAIDYIAKASTCNHITQSRGDSGDWDVNAIVNGPISEGDADVSSEFYTITVVVKKDASKSCVICWDGMFDNFISTAVSTFPLEAPCV